MFGRKRSKYPKAYMGRCVRCKRADYLIRGTSLCERCLRALGKKP